MVYPYKSDLYDVAVDLIHETAMAWLVSDGTENHKVWIPKSQAEFDYDTKILTAPEWLLKSKGLI